MSTIKRYYFGDFCPAFGTCNRCSCYSYCHQNVTGYGQPVKPFDPMAVTSKRIHVTVGYYFPRTVTNERRPSNHSDNFCVSFRSFLLYGNQSDDSATSFIIPPNGNNLTMPASSFIIDLNQQPIRRFRSIFYHCPKRVTNQTVPATHYDLPSSPTVTSRTTSGTRFHSCLQTYN